jgi:hypothetical protein
MNEQGALLTARLDSQIRIKREIGSLAAALSLGDLSNEPYAAIM